MTREQLIAALEAATEGSRELDEQIASECNILLYPHYTTSIDAALTLVPEGCIWKVFSDYPGDAYFADVEKWVPGQGGPENWRTDGACSSPALALCIAALRARSES